MASFEVGDGGVCSVVFGVGVSTNGGWGVDEAAGLADGVGSGVAEIDDRNRFTIIW